MARINPESILLIGDANHEIESALTQVAPQARLTAVATYFDGIAELSGSSYSAVIASAEPIERRPEAAVRALRNLAEGSHLVLFGHPTLEPVARKMLEFGCDDYMVTPPNPGELQQIFGQPRLRIAQGDTPTVAPAESILPATTAEGSSGAESFERPSTIADSLHALPTADILLDALVQQPHSAATAAIRQMNRLLPARAQLAYLPAGKPSAPAPEGMTILSHAVRVHNGEAGQLQLQIPDGEENDAAEGAARHALSQLARQLGNVALLQDRHQGLVRQATIDELTAAYNRRWFKHFLVSILEKARVKRFAVTLLLFDIDDFKKYNDRFGHQLGDEILRETARLMRRCSREHDLVARIGGDEFAVVFWEKEGPRQPKDPAKPLMLRVQQTPRQIFERFQRLIATQDFPALGTSGQGMLTISGGFASFPWDGRDMNELIDAADKDLMFGAKARKNTITLVGNQGIIAEPASTVEPAD